MSTTTYGKLFLIPNLLHPENPDDFICDMVRRMAHPLRNFVVENEKQARALIRRLKLQHAQNDLQFWLLNEHTTPQEFPALLKALEGEDAGVISDAGLPCVADPGSALVALAQAKGIEVVPLPGAGSLMMALMGSGFSGQKFTFSGYLPIDKGPRVKALRDLEAQALRGTTQIFMETPYRNLQLLESLVQNLQPQTHLCIACNLSAPDGWVKTKTLAAWKKQTPDLHKKPCVFVLGSPEG